MLNLHLVPEKIRMARRLITSTINGTVRALFKTRLIFPRINGPNVP